MGIKKLSRPLVYDKSCIFMGVAEAREGGEEKGNALGPGVGPNKGSGGQAKSPGEGKKKSWVEKERRPVGTPALKKKQGNEGDREGGQNGRIMRHSKNH